MKERWRAVKGYEGLYSVSSHGRVLSRARVVRGRYGMRQVRKQFVAKTPDAHGHNIVKLYKKNKGKVVRVGRLVYETFVGPVGKLDVDHKNRNRLDDKLSNLRPATRKQNLQNASKRKGTSSKYKGVSWFARTGRWRAYIKVDAKQIHLGFFDTEKEAARAYDKAARKHFDKNFAALNFTKDKK